MEYVCTKKTTSHKIVSADFSPLPLQVFSVVSNFKP